MSVEWTAPGDYEDMPSPPLPKLQRWIPGTRTREKADARIAGDARRRRVRAKRITEHSAVYVVYDGEYLKIGSSFDVRIRMRELQVGNARSLRLVSRLSNDPSDERHWHCKMRHHRVRGEWYRVTADSVAILNISLTDLTACESASPPVPSDRPVAPPPAGQA